MNGEGRGGGGMQRRRGGRGGRGGEGEGGGEGAIELNNFWFHIFFFALSLFTEHRKLKMKFYSPLQASGINL
jgi:hypothetical protein